MTGSVTSLASGGMLVVAGDMVDLYNPTNGQTTHGTADGVWWEAGWRLPDGRALFVGEPNGVRSVAIYDPNTDHWTATLQLHTTYYGTFALTHDGKLLVLGGGERANEQYPCDFVNSRKVQRYDPLTNTVTTMPPLLYPISAGGLATFSDGRILLMPWSGTRKAQIFAPKR